VRCTSEVAHPDCAELLELLHRYARFALHLSEADAPLPHGKEIKVQGGGLLGLQQIVWPERADEGVDDISVLLKSAGNRFCEWDEIPTAEIVRAIATYQGRRKRS